MPAPHPRMHSRSHAHGGPDPVGISWEDTGSSSGGSGGSIDATFHDTADDPFSQARWALNTFQIRNAQLDAGDATAWSQPPTATYTDTVAVTATGELVYAFLLKDYIRGLTSLAPFTDLYNQQVPNLVSGGQLFAARASGQGSGTVTYQATIPAADVGNQKTQSILVGLKGSGGTPSQLSLKTTFVDSNPHATAALPSPASLLSGDLLLLQIAERNGNAAPVLVAPAGWTLVAASPSRTVDTLAGVLDQWIYRYTVA